MSLRHHHHALHRYRLAGCTASSNPRTLILYSSSGSSSFFFIQSNPSIIKASIEEVRRFFLQISEVLGSRRACVRGIVHAYSRQVRTTINFRHRTGIINRLLLVTVVCTPRIRIKCAKPSRPSRPHRMPLSRNLSSGVDGLSQAPIRQP